MRKIRLKIDDLAVESFSPAGSKANEEGTVRGHETEQWGCNSELSNCASCLEGCPRDTMTCFGSCRNSVYYQGGPCEPYIDPYC